MAKNTVADWDTTAANNTDVGGINIAEGTAMSNLNNAIREMMAQIKAASSGSAFSDSNFRIQDNGDATKQLAFEVSGITAGQTRTITPPNSNALMAALDIEDQTLTGGARVTSKSLGTITTGTVTLDPGDRPLQHYTNNGPHTLAPGSNSGSILLEIVNGASAGAITTSGFTKVTGSFTTTNGHRFHCSVVRGSAYSSLTIVPLQ